MELYGKLAKIVIAIGYATFFVSNYHYEKSSIQALFSDPNRRRLSLYFGEGKCK